MFGFSALQPPKGPQTKFSTETPHPTWPETGYVSVRMSAIVCRVSWVCPTRSRQLWRIHTSRSPDTPCRNHVKWPDCRAVALWSFQFISQGTESCSMTRFVWWFHRWQLSGLQQRLLLSSRNRNSSNSKTLCVQTSTVELTNFALNIKCRWSRLLCTYGIPAARPGLENDISV